MQERVIKCFTAAIRDRSEKKCVRNNPPDTKVSEEERGRSTPGVGTQIPCSPHFIECLST